MTSYMKSGGAGAETEAGDMNSVFLGICHSCREDKHLMQLTNDVSPYTVKHKIMARNYHELSVRNCLLYIKKSMKWK